MKTELELGKTYRIKYSDGSKVYLKFTGGREPSCDVWKNTTENVEQCLKGADKIEECDMEVIVNGIDIFNLTSVKQKQ
jgi:metal-sulfur cluster biosynthetic enzyme